jgi:NADH:ubiquinone oxidoreductase subunit B-like Fe-S oxidoreductase
MGVALEKISGVLQKFPGGSVLVTSFDAVANRARANSLWPLAFGTKCCAIEMLMATGGPVAAAGGPHGYRRRDRQEDGALRAPAL